MKNSDDLNKQKIYEIKKDYTMFFFGFLVAHSYITTLIHSGKISFLTNQLCMLSFFTNPCTYFVIYFFIKLNANMNIEICKNIKY